MQKQVQYIIKGMNRDMTVSKFPADHSFENKNIRITQTAGQTLLSVTNEKGPSEVELTWDKIVLYNNITLDTDSDCIIYGKILGHCAIRQYLILFVRMNTHQHISAGLNSADKYVDTIYRIEPETGKVVILVQSESWEYTSSLNEIFTSSLSFGDNVQAFGFYENDDIIKVYWVDGRNQNRVINIVDPIRLKYDSSLNKYINTFTVNDTNFIPLQSFNETIDIERVDSSNGVFAPGTIQYVLTYHNMYGQETSIFYQSDLYYTSFEDRGGSEEEVVSNAFQITLHNLDTSFDYVRIYSILRTSINATPQCNLVADIKVESRDIVFIDNGTKGEGYDYNALLYMNGELFSSKTLAEKDNTLFSGNINLLIPKIPDDIKTYLRNSVVCASEGITSTTGSNIEIAFTNDKSYSVGGTGSHYPYNIHLNQNQGEITTFKYLEYYRFGIQFLHKSGKWSEAIFLADIQNKTPINTGILLAGPNQTSTGLVQATFTFDPGSDFNSIWFAANGFIKMRPIVVYPELWDRNILAQGLVCPTVYNVEDRAKNRPFSYSSWYARPNPGANVTWVNGANPNTTNRLGDPKGVYVEYRHNTQLPKSTEVNAEIQCIRDEIFPMAVSSVEKDVWVGNHRENFFVDKSIITFHSPEIELSTDLDVIDLSNVKFRIIGIAPLTSFDSDIYLSTSTIGNPTFNQELWKGSEIGKDDDDHEVTDDSVSASNSMIAPGFYDEKIGVTNISTDGWKCRMGNINWIDEETHYAFKSAQAGHIHKKGPKWYGFFVYPWHRSKSLNNTVVPNENGWESALLENKTITNSRYSYNSHYFAIPWSPDNGVSGIKLANIEPQSEESEVSLIKLPEPENSHLGDLNYYGSVDKVVVMSNADYKSVGYPFVIAASSRLTGRKNEQRVHWDDVVGEGYGDSPGYEGARALTFHELFTGQYDSVYKARAAALGDDYTTYPIYTNHPEGTLSEYLPYGFVAENHPGSTPVGVDHDENVWSNYITATDDHARRVFWQVSTFDPIRIRFKSTKHAVMAFNYTIDNKQIILPAFDSTYDKEGTHSYNNSRFFWDLGKLTNYCTGVADQHLLSNAEARLPGASVVPMFGYLFLGELYRDDITSATRFGGTSEEALEKNTWLPAGEIADIPSYNANNPANDSVQMIADRGDTFYQRYDCLKTYPFTPDEKNSIIETVSFMCETRINCDGRYDKNRGNATKFTITPKNFNLMNPVYNQKNNFFNYQALNSNRVYPDHFNQITWSMTKSLGEEVDTWAKINLSSILDMDGEYGEIVALVFFNNDIWCFQERGISKILFNSRVQIPVSDGVPIEITNGMKVQGKIYLTTKAGCQNKFAITTTPNGVYFIDGYNNTISIFNGQSIQNVSDIKGFREWMYAQDAVTEWKNNPRYGNHSANGYKTFYDSVHQDVYFVNDDNCLVFSELLAEFTSFYDYNKTPVMDTIHEEFWSATNFDEQNNNVTDPRVRLWKMFDGEYNMFYKPADVPDEVIPEDPEEETTYPWKAYYKPFYVQYNVNPDPTLDKTFDNIEFRSDSWDNNSLVTSTESAGTDKTFDTLEAENEYQYGMLPLSFSHAQYSQDSTLKRKFRVWRTIMPRESGTRNRIRNTWCKVKLSWQNPNRYKTILHDVVVKYFV